jgi:hypothetical protein
LTQDAQEAGFCRWTPFVKTPFGLFGLLPVEWLKFFQDKAQGNTKLKGVAFDFHFFVFEQTTSSPFPRAVLHTGRRMKSM